MTCQSCQLMNFIWFSKELHSFSLKNLYLFSPTLELLQPRKNTANDEPSGTHVRMPCATSLVEFSDGACLCGGSWKFQVSKNPFLVEKVWPIMKKVLADVNFLVELCVAFVVFVVVVATVISVFGFLFELLCFCFCLCGCFFVLPSRHHSQVLGGFLPLGKPCIHPFFFAICGCFPQSVRLVASIHFTEFVKVMF